MSDSYLKCHDNQISVEVEKYCKFVNHNTPIRYKCVIHDV